MRALASTLSLRSAHGYILAPFIIVYLLLIQYCRTNYYRDPTSAFFDKGRGFTPIYSRFRESQAANFVRNVNGSAPRPVNQTLSSDATNKPTNSSNASFCVGIASVSRQETNYIESAVGSLLVDLTEDERKDIHLILFIPHTDPTVHPSYSSGWLHAAADTVLLYDFPKGQMKHINKLEQGGGRPKEKALFDYMYLLKACEALGSPYVVMIEDDVVAMDGWYHRTRQALEDAESQTAEIGASQYLYLRLFYTHKFLGWNSEEAFTYFLSSLFVVASVGGILIATRRLVPRTNRFLPNDTIVIICFVCTPLSILLFFAAGRASMLPISTGVHQMPRFGCCTQALAFPRDRVADVIDWYESQQTGDADSLLERFANENNEIRWALTPSLFQHIGTRSSKFENGEPRIAQSIWNYHFELNDPIALHIEHEAAVSS
ncbi:hypothetical protein PISL3812_03996 [Talaromyces islandicus]|uniref:Integral membrane protein n=1 Tax=Talaromyces islandicus TaxID=28573 RepID=A0A0U1LU88_TALIS|nr:hypothetical protein PISL3812_03996 [Talaromyces islandicus]